MVKLDVPIFWLSSRKATIYGRTCSRCSYCASWTISGKKKARISNSSRTAAYQLATNWGAPSSAPLTSPLLCSCFDCVKSLWCRSFIEVVTKSNTCAGITNEIGGGALGVFDKEVIERWLREKNPDQEAHGAPFLLFGPAER